MKKFPYRNSSETLKHWFVEIPSAHSRRSHDERVKIWPDSFDSELAMYLKNPRGDYIILRDRLDKANSDWLAKNNPLFTEEIKAYWHRFLDGYLREGEYKLFSFLALNEFLAQDEHFVYRDFLEEKTDEVYEQLSGLKFPIYPTTTTTVLKSLYSSEHILQLRPSASDEVKDAVELLNKSQILSILSEPDAYQRTQPGNVAKVIAAKIAKQNGDTERLPSTDQVYNTFFLAFSKSLVNESASAGYRFDKLSTLLVIHLSGLMKDVYTQTEYSNIGQISSSQALELSKYFLSIAEELTPRELFALVAGIGNPGLFARGTRQAAREFIINATKIERNDSIALFKSLAEIISSYDDGLPTSAQWLKGLKADELVVESGSMMAVIVSGGLERPHISEAQRRFRRELNLYCAS